MKLSMIAFIQIVVVISYPVLPPIQRRADSVELFYSTIESILPEYRADAVATFIRKREQKIHETHEDEKQKIKQKIQRERMDLVDTFFKDAVSKHQCQNPDKYANVQALPSQIQGQVYNTANEDWLKTSYRKLYLPFISESTLPIAECIRGNLTEENYTPEQFAWSMPKTWKSAHKYAHPSNSSAYLEYESRLKEVDENATIIHDDDEPVSVPLKFPIRTRAAYEIYKLIKFDGLSFLQVLEAKNKWFITKQDCDMINILRRCEHQVEFECRLFEKSPGLAVALFPNWHTEPFGEMCDIRI